jgi:hypothetical protein
MGLIRTILRKISPIYREEDNVRTLRVTAEKALLAAGFQLVGWEAKPTIRRPIWQVEMQIWTPGSEKPRRVFSYVGGTHKITPADAERLAGSIVHHIKHKRQGAIVHD